MALGGDCIGHQIQMFRVQWVDLFRNALVKPEHVTEPIGVFGAAAVAKLPQQERGGRAPFFIGIGAYHFKGIAQPVSRPFDNLRKPRVKKAVRGIGHRASHQAASPDSFVNHAVGRPVYRSLRSRKISGSQLASKIGQVILNMGVRIDCRCGHCQFI